MGFQKILVPIDGSENSARALAQAGYLAELCQASVTVLHVMNLFAEVPAMAQIGTDGYIPDRVLEEAQESKRLMISEALKKLPPSVAAKGLLEIGRPTEVIINFLAENKYDLIVMGSRGLGTVKGLLLGSVSSYVVREAACPVMVVK
jgi:nucleotide-binding universal stress UspA family protein